MQPINADIQTKSRNCRRFFAVLLLLLGGCCGLRAQSVADSTAKPEPRITWHVDGVSEGQWNMGGGRGNWANLLSAGLEVRTWHGGCLEVAALATGRLKDGVADDLQDFSNINAENRGFRLTHLGIGQRFGDKVFAFVGLREADEDYFNTGGAAVFTGSSYGCAPHTGENFALAVFPDAALGVHLEYYPHADWAVRTSFYNGTASDRPRRQFRFRPGEDGLVNVGSVSFSPTPVRFTDGAGNLPEGVLAPNYVVGYMAGWQYVREDAADGLPVPPLPVETRRRGAAVWGSVDQPLLRFRHTCLNLFAMGGARIGQLGTARGHWATALSLGHVTRRGGTLAMGVSQAFYAAGVRETDFETTFDLPILPWLSLQPALHVVRTDGVTDVIGNLRLNICLGNL